MRATLLHTWDARSDLHGGVAVLNHDEVDPCGRARHRHQSHQPFVVEMKYVHYAYSGRYSEVLITESQACQIDVSRAMDKREFARVAVELAVSFSGSGVSGGGLLSGLSTRGCTMITDELIQRGTTVALQIQLPEPYTPLKVDLAEVRWADGRDAGLEFLRLRLEEKQRLQGFIRAVQGPKRAGR